MRIVVDVRVNILNFSHVINGLFSPTVWRCGARFRAQEGKKKAEGSTKRNEQNKSQQNEIKINAKITELLKPFSR
jgi:hypothetical protein